MPFVLNSQPAAAYDEAQDKSLASMATTAHRGYADIMRHVEALVKDHSALVPLRIVPLQSLTLDYEVEQQNAMKPRSKLSMLVPTIGMFFTPLALEAAFLHQDAIRAISSRRFVPPSFNDIRLILNTAQIISLICPSPTSNAPPSGLKLLTFDGDVTLYEDGGSLTSDNPVISRLLHFLGKDVKIGIVTAAGYTDSSKYFARLSGLIEAVQCSQDLTAEQKQGLIISKSFHFS